MGRCLPTPMITLGVGWPAGARGRAVRAWQGQGEPAGQRTRHVALPQVGVQRQGVVLRAPETLLVGFHHRREQARDPRQDINALHVHQRYPQPRRRQDLHLPQGRQSLTNTSRVLIQLFESVRTLCQAEHKRRNVEGAEVLPPSTPLSRPPLSPSPSLPLPTPPSRVRVPTTAKHTPTFGQVSSQPSSSLHALAWPPLSLALGGAVAGPRHRSAFHERVSEMQFSYTLSAMSGQITGWRGNGSAMRFHHHLAVCNSCREPYSLQF